jgi:hypothetical protein
MLLTPWGPDLRISVSDGIRAQNEKSCWIVRHRPAAFLAFNKGMWPLRSTLTKNLTRSRSEGRSRTVLERSSRVLGLMQIPPVESSAGTGRNPPQPRSWKVN